VQAARAEEAEGRLEHLLVRPVGRGRWLLVRIATAIAVLVTAAAAYAAVMVTRLWRRIGTGPAAKRRGLATRTELSRLSPRAQRARAAHLRPSLGDGKKIRTTDVAVVVGQIDGMQMTASVEESVFAAAAPRQGKSSGIVIPWVTDWPGPAVVTSVRTDVLEATAFIRAEQGPIAVLSGGDMSAWPQALHWSPIAGCTDADLAAKRARMFVDVSAVSENGAGDTNKFYRDSAATLIAGLFHAAALHGYDARQVLKWVYTPGDDTPLRLLGSHPGTHELSVYRLSGIYSQDPETRSNTFSTAQNALAGLAQGKMAETAFLIEPAESVDLPKALRENATFYLILSEEDAEGLAPVIAAFVDQLIRDAKTLANRQGGRLDPPLGIFGDEIGNIFPLPKLPSLMSSSGGYGIFILAVLQSFAQARAKWGVHGAAQMWSNSTYKIALGGLSADDAEEFAKLAGTVEETVMTYSHSPGGGYTQQYSTRQGPALTAAQVRQLDPDGREALVVHATSPAALVSLTRHYEGHNAARHADSVRRVRELMAHVGIEPSASDAEDPVAQDGAA